ncbi:MAG: methyltransferase domain-containing protein [Acidobacteriota bacterium]|nr:methyltransferase domain-containing protein [Acidobacteriota bacterium]
MFSNRTVKPELLDHVPADEARPNLADLVRINQRLGGHSVLRKTLAGVVNPADTFSLLDVGAASGDTARTIQALYPGASITCLDYNQTNLEKAPKPKLMADAFRLPFAPESFDYVICSLFLHHFQNEEIVDLLGSFHRTARRALLVIDLERNVLPYVFLAITKPIFGWNRITVHDGLISVKASFHSAELRTLAENAGIRRLEIKRHRPAFRLAMIGWK